MDNSQAIKETWFDSREFKLTQGVIKKLIADYAREPGVRVMGNSYRNYVEKAALKKVSSKRKIVFCS